MHIENFEIALKKAESWFKKSLTAEQMEIYFTHLEFIPDVAIVGIINDTIKNTKPMPGNFPTINDIKAGWLKWQNDHPDKIRRQQRVDCNECGGCGWLWFKTEDPITKTINEFIVACEYCKNNKIDIGTSRRVTQSNREKLETKGYEVFPYKYKSRKKFKNFDEMKSAATKRIIL